ncbi:hypothetical protein LSTR_LSTR016113 [Laodelphax striatellus]|uniref:Uncharacterized protein n=1 Tax=Laodelphax striatellus TaxID=195883 RepID=A0A482WPA2_LAOST|nr:hypothetical protein LSTR_LSTR016113 [Laodelphax striatellus]
MLNEANVENESLKEKLRMNKESRNSIVEDSLVNEKQAESEIYALQLKIEDLEETVESLQLEISSKNEIIKLLEDDSKRIPSTFDKGEMHFNSSPCRRASENSFRIPKMTSRMRRSLPSNPVVTANRFSVLDDDDFLSLKESGQSNNNMNAESDPEFNGVLIDQNEEDDSQPMIPTRRVFQTRAQLHRSATPKAARHSKTTPTIARSLNIRFFADSQGRDVYKNYNVNNHTFSAMVKPGARFGDVVRETVRHSE